jgi:hypothetical protein
MMKSSSAGWFPILIAAIAAGCSSKYWMRSDPPPTPMPGRFEEPLPARVAVVLFEPQDPKDEPVLGGKPADLTGLFVDRLREVGLFREVQYPVLSTDRFEMTMEIHQSGHDEPSYGTRVLFVPLVFTLGLIAPFVTAEHDYETQGGVTLKIRSETVATYSARNHLELSFKLGRTEACFEEALRQAIAGMQKMNLNPELDDDRLKYANHVAKKYMKRFRDMVKRSSPRASVFFNGRSFGKLADELPVQVEEWLDREGSFRHLEHAPVDFGFNLIAQFQLFAFL